MEDLDAILAGDMDVLDKVLKDLGETTLNQVLPALQNLAKVEKQLADVQTRRLALEDKYNYRCFACGCTDNILKKNTQCPLENNKW